MFPGQFVQKVGKRTKIGKASVTQAITAVMISEKLRKRIQRRTYKTERDVWREQGAFQLQEEIQTQVRSSISAMNGFPVFFPFEIGQGLFKIRFSQSAFRLVQWDQTHHLILRNS